MTTKEYSLWFSTKLMSSITYNPSLNFSSSSSNTPVFSELITSSSARQPLNQSLLTDMTPSCLNILILYSGSSITLTLEFKTLQTQLSSHLYYHTSN